MIYRPSLTEGIAFPGSKINGSIVLGEGIRLNFLMIEAIANLVSSRANLIPIHPLGPCPNGKKAYLKIGKTMMGIH